MVKKAVKKSIKKAVKSKKGSRYSCDVCGIVISVDSECGCVDACDIVCCGEQMKAKKQA